MTALSVDAVASGYGHTTVVRRVSLDVAEGEVVAVLGRNGAGKSTLLSTIAGFIRPTEGTITLSGADLRPGDPSSAVALGLQFVPESRSLFTQLTVRDNLAVAGARKRRDLAVATAHFPELEALLDRKAGLLSGGEQQMLAIARALVRRPSVLLVDELSMGLAPVICRRLAQILREISRSERMSVVLVEQHIHMALDVADRAYVMRRGEISHTGTAGDLLEDLDRVRAAYLPDAEATHGSET